MVAAPRGARTFHAPAWRERERLGNKSRCRHRVQESRCSHSRSRRHEGAWKFERRAELVVGCVLVLVLGTARLNSVSTTACSNARTAARARSFEHAEVSTWRRSAPPRSIGVRLFAFAASTTGSIHQLKLGPCDFRRWATGQPHAICSVCAFDAAARGENHAGAGHAGAGLTTKNGYGRGIARSGRAPPERWLLLQ